MIYCKSYAVYVLVYCSFARARNTSHNQRTVGERSPSLYPQLKVVTTMHREKQYINQIQRS